MLNSIIYLTAIANRTILNSTLWINLTCVCNIDINGYLQEVQLLISLLQLLHKVEHAIQ